MIVSDFFQILCRNCSFIPRCSFLFRLKALDVVTLQRLAERVNVIPVIAKADTTCKDELIRFKSKVVTPIFLKFTLLKL